MNKVIFSVAFVIFFSLLGCNSNPNDFVELDLKLNEEINNRLNYNYKLMSDIQTEYSLQAMKGMGTESFRYIQYLKIVSDSIFHSCANLNNFIVSNYNKEVNLLSDEQLSDCHKIWNEYFILLEQSTLFSQLQNIWEISQNPKKLESFNKALRKNQKDLNKLTNGLRNTCDQTDFYILEDQLIEFSEQLSTALVSDNNLNFDKLISSLIIRPYTISEFDFKTFDSNSYTTKLLKKIKRQKIDLKLDTTMYLIDKLKYDLVLYLSNYQANNFYVKNTSLDQNYFYSFDTKLLRKIVKSGDYNEKAIDSILNLQIMTSKINSEDKDAIKEILTILSIDKNENPNYFLLQIQEALTTALDKIHLRATLPSRFIEDLLKSGPIDSNTRTFTVNTDKGFTKIPIFKKDYPEYIDISYWVDDSSQYLLPKRQQNKLNVIEFSGYSTDSIVVPAKPGTHFLYGNYRKKEKGVFKYKPWKVSYIIKNEGIFSNNIIEGKYLGLIDDKYAIEMYLNSSDNKIGGRYRYKTSNTFLQLAGEIYDGIFTIEEFNQKGDNTGIFEGSIKGSILYGYWKNSKNLKKLKFEVSRQEKQVMCTEKDYSKEEYNDLIEGYLNNEKTVTTCEYENIRIVTTTEVEDYRGYLEKSQILYLKIDDKYLMVNNSQIFNAKQLNLIKEINKLIREDYEKYFNESTDCFGILPEDLKYDMNELEISISNDGISFFADWNLSNACRSVDNGSTISFSFDQISEYLDKTVYKN